MRTSQWLTIILLIGVVAIVGCERKIVNEAEQDDLAASSCFTCHGDQDFRLVAARQQYNNSKHGSGDNINRNRNQASYYQTCERCHTMEGFVEQIGGPEATGEHFSTISCFACHEPHTNGNLSLRASGPVTLADGEVFDFGKGNLCANCHQSRRDVNTYVSEEVTLSTHWGPHYSDQADVLMGTGGYEYDGVTYNNSAHSSVALRGCVDCHMGTSQANLVGGHTFAMRDENDEFENIFGCNVTGCHAADPLNSINRMADQDFDGDGTIEGVQDEIKAMLSELKSELIAANLLMLDPEDPDSSYHPVDGRVISDIDSSGALWNYLVIAEERSYGIHNTDYAVALLESAMNFITTGNPSGISRRVGSELAVAH